MRQAAVYLLVSTTMWSVKCGLKKEENSLGFDETADDVFLLQHHANSRSTSHEYIGWVVESKA